MFFCQLPERGIIKVTGLHAKNFLQGLLTNDINKAEPGKWLYALFLTPQGKIISDCFIQTIAEDAFILDVPHAQIAALLPKLNLYKLRQQVVITDISADWKVMISASQLNAHYAADPRNAQLGWRAVIASDTSKTDNFTVADDYHSRRIGLLIPDCSLDLQQDKFFPAELDMNSLSAIDYQKGCYVGQEVTARTKYRGTVRKQLYRISFRHSEPFPYGADVQINGQVLGKMLGSIATEGLALLRIEMADQHSDERRIVL